MWKDHSWKCQFLVYLFYVNNAKLPKSPTLLPRVITLVHFYLSFTGNNIAFVSIMKCSKRFRRVDSILNIWILPNEDNSNNYETGTTVKTIKAPGRFVSRFH